MVLAVLKGFDGVFVIRVTVGKNIVNYCCRAPAKINTTLQNSEKQNGW